MVAGFDLFYLFVENVFGGYLITAVGLSICMILIGMISRMSFILISFIVG